MNKKLLYFAFFLAFFVSCESDDDSSSNNNQLDRIASYVEKEYTTYRKIENSVYVANVDDEVISGERIAIGDTVYLDYAIYQFYSSIDKLIYTNIEEYALDFNFDTEDMSLDPLKVEYGTTQIIKGLDLALDGMVEGASYMVYMPSNYAYDDKINGIVPKNSSLAIYVKITSLDKSK